MDGMRSKMLVALGGQVSQCSVEGSDTETKGVRSDDSDTGEPMPSTPGLRFKPFSVAGWYGEKQFVILPPDQGNRSRIQIAGTGKRDALSGDGQVGEKQFRADAALIAQMP